MEKTSFEFGVKSQAYEDRLRQAGQWEKFNLLRENAKTELRTYEADYKAHRIQRIEGKSKEFAERQKLEMKGPQISGAPAKRLLTADDIKGLATSHVDTQHKAGYQEIYRRRHTEINQFVQRELRFPKDFGQTRSGWLREMEPGRD